MTAYIHAARSEGRQWRRDLRNAGIAFRVESDPVDARKVFVGVAAEAGAGSAADLSASATSCGCNPDKSPTPGESTMRINDSTLYFTDNGAVYCGAHLGACARYTGRDISGQPIEPVTPEAAKEAKAMGFAIRCENPRCGRTPSLLHTATI